MMRNGKYISAERGTLLVEAIAMLGLIALVTPTLYQKSAERLQEIQDINTASQARTMNTIVETFVKANFSEMLVTASSTPNETIELIYNDDNIGCPAGNVCYHKGYSAYVPFGYSPGNLKNYGSPRVYVHHDRATGKDTLMSYVIYPTDIDVGKKRAARIASLVGANGGTMTTPFTGGSSLEIFGTGGAWYLDNSSITNEVGIDPDLMVDNSLVVASTEPITMSDMDSEKFLYRVPPDDDGKAFHNQMVTDLYMGGHNDETAWADHAQNKFYSIFNVRKLTLNTRCTRSHIGPGGSSNADCDERIQNVADLYIGKPTLEGFDSSNATYSPGVGDHNTGAAWFYGNLSALNQSFHLHRESSETSWDREHGFDVLDFARVDEENPDNIEFSVLQASNEEDNAKVSMLDGFVIARDASSGVDYEFMVGRKTGSSVSEISNDGSWIHALNDGSIHALRLNSPDEMEDLNPENMETWINARGGVVHINGGSSDADYKMDTLINDQGGNLEAGKDAGWIKAVNRDTSAQVILLNGKDINSSGVNGAGDQRIFAVGTDDAGGNYMIRGEGGRRVALRGGQVRVYNYTATTTDSSATGSIGGRSFVRDYLENTSMGGTGDNVPETLTGATALLSRYTDILGSTYMGAGDMQQAQEGVDDGSIYTRGAWTLGVAGSAWVDQLLWARRAWFNEAGMRELHAGFSSFADYKANPKAGWLNAYDDSVIIRNPQLAKAKGNGNIKGSDSSDIMFLADSSRVFMRVQEGGSWGEITMDGARLGTVHNRFWAEEDASSGVSSANLAGSSLVNIYTDVADKGESSVVNIQRDAMIFAGHPFTDSSYIDTRTQDFRLHTTNDGTDVDSAQLIADSSQIRTRYVDFSVENNDSAAVFKVMPNLKTEDSSDANVLVDGSFHVTGNKVIHVASNSYNRAENGKEYHAMFEVDPQYVQVWAKKDGENGNYAKTGSGNEEDYYALVKINPYDVSGSSSSGVDHNASVYIRRGAIELEQSTSSAVDAGWAADEGFGYIMANRMVSNAEGVSVPQGKVTYGTVNMPYDKYMVNPAYTSVMHDIKLTTRGGARLSDILPDYVLKGIYNLINNCEEGQTGETRCEYEGTDKWADPYIGILPYAKCPPGYRNMATVVPISFNVGQAGELTKKNGRYTVSAMKQADLLNRTGSSMADVGDAIVYPGLEEVSTVVYNEIYSSDHTFSSFVSNTYSRSEGWFLGFPMTYGDSSYTQPESEMEPDGTGWKYKIDKTASDNFKQVAMPLYFQQNTWLKTTVRPEVSGGQGWRAYMGFLYDREYWAEEQLGGITASVKSNFNEEPDGEGDDSDLYVWNLFPVPTNTLEGHATVYCYFDRSIYKGDGKWGDLVDPVDQLNDYHAASSVSNDEAYRKRLNDPTLRYDDPW